MRAADVLFASRAESKPQNAAKAKPSNSFESYLKAEAPKAGDNKVQTNRPESSATERPDNEAQAPATDVGDENKAAANNTDGNNAVSNEAVANEGKTVDEAEGESDGEVSNEQQKPVEQPVSDTSAEDEKLAEIAAMFGMSVQDVIAVLAELGIDLSLGITPEQRTELVTALTGASSPVELLWQPEAVTMLEQVDAIAQNFAPAENKPVNNTEAGKTAEQAAQVSDTTVESAVIPVEGLTREQGGESLSQDSAVLQMPEDIPRDKPKAEVTENPADTAFVPMTDEDGGMVSVLTADKPEVVEVSSGKAAASVKAEAAEDEVPVAVNMTQQPSNEAHSRDIERTREVLTPARTAAENAEVVKQLTDHIKVHVTTDTTELRLTLRPESLGEVTMRVITQNGIVTAQLFAETQRIKEIIEASLTELKQSLMDKGMTVGDMSAFVADRDTERGFGWNGDTGRSGRVLSGSRVNRVMRRNGLEGAEAIDAEAREQEEKPRNPLVVDMKA